MQNRRSNSPVTQDAAKRRRLEQAPTKTLSATETRVVEHAADILGVPLDVLLSLNLPLSQIVSGRPPESRNDSANITPVVQANNISTPSTGQRNWSNRAIASTSASVELPQSDQLTGLMPVDLWQDFDSSSSNASAKAPSIDTSAPRYVSTNSSVSARTQQTDHLTNTNAINIWQESDPSSSSALTDNIFDGSLWDMLAAPADDFNDFSNAFSTVQETNLSYATAWGNFNPPLAEWMPMINGQTKLQEFNMFQTPLVDRPAPSFTFQATSSELGHRVDRVEIQGGMIDNNSEVASHVEDDLVQEFFQENHRSVQRSVKSSQKVNTPSRKRASNATGQRARRSAFKSTQERQQTHQTRQYGACTLCRVQKKRCLPTEDPDKPCLTCIMRSREGLSTPPCVRVKMAEAALYDKGSHPQHIWTKRWDSMNIVEIADWYSHEVKTITVTQEVGDISYKLQVKRFVPMEGDSLERKWYSNGVPKSHKTATYAIADMRATGQKLMKFVHDNVAVTVAHNLDHGDRLLTPVYLMALEYRTSAENEDERRLVRNVLQLWTAIRMESRSEFIIGEETLGMDPQLQDMNHHNYGKYLIPPVVSAQIELITTAIILKPLKQQVLRQLQAMITDKKKTHWFTIYLCSFILLHSCALLTDYQRHLGIKRGRKTRYDFDDFIRELHSGAKTILMYFHLCNIGVRPFSPLHVASFVKTAGLKDEEARFLNATVKVIEEKKALFRQIQDEKHVEHKYYFLSQLYDEDWLSSVKF